MRAITHDDHQPQLAPDAVTILDFAENIVNKSGNVTQADVDRLKSFGLSDAEIQEITLAAAIRTFFSKTLNTLNAEPDARVRPHDPDIRRVLPVGRPSSDR